MTGQPQNCPKVPVRPNAPACMYDLQARTYAALGKRQEEHHALGQLFLELAGQPGFAENRFGVFVRNLGQ